MAPLLSRAVLKSAPLRSSSESSRDTSIDEERGLTTMASNPTDLANPIPTDPRALPVSSAIERTSTISRYPTWTGITAAAGSAHLGQDIDTSAEDKDSHSPTSRGNVAAVQPAPINNTGKRDDVVTWQLRQTLEGHTDYVWSVAFSHDSKLLASGSGAGDKTIRIWDTATWQLRQTLEGHTRGVWSVAFSHDSKLLASGSVSGDKAIRIWDTATWQLRQTLKGHTRGVRSVAFSHDSKLLASGSGDETIRIWDTATSIQR